MTTNIKALTKALAEEMARLPNAYSATEHKLATALLKVLEDGERLNKALSQSRGQWIHSVNKDDALKALESHEKLMEELGGE